MSNIIQLYNGMVGIDTKRLVYKQLAYKKVENNFKILHNINIFFISLYYKINNMEKKVKYINKVTNLGECKLQAYGSKEVSQSYIKQYYNTLANLIGLNSCSRDLMDYLAEIMDDNNEVSNSIRVREKFLQTIKERSMKPDGTFQDYADVTIIQSFAALVDRGCLVKIMKGLYRVNPELYFKGTVKERMESIKITLEFMEGARDPSMKVVTKMKDR